MEKTTQTSSCEDKAKWLQTHYEWDAKYRVGANRGKNASRVTVSEVRDVLRGNFGYISCQNAGSIVAKAFPGCKKERSYNQGKCYYGIRKIRTTESPTSRNGGVFSPTTSQWCQQAQLRQLETENETLRTKVPFQHTEWSRLLPLPQAWAAFMDRVYHAVLEGRRAELEMQQKHQTDTEEEVKYKQDIAWLWVRDKLVDIIKTASVGNPTAQANSVLAVAGLAGTVMKYMASLGAEATRIQQEASEHNSCPHWLGMLTDLLMCVADSKYKPKGRTLGLFQQESRGGAPSCSMLARACSSLAFSQFIPVLVTNNVERIRHMIRILVSGLPGQPQADESSAVVFCHGVGLGMVLARCSIAYKYFDYPCQTVV
ncbi:FOCAD [Branchiostoma lanceolatum]|uniref:FOCAD protein n=1 Tax=Branchiostoma lanceolatum TaxID=7740 RepID=A0A8S4MLK6_BRALA|nr:FOCAD [Branchiostoma lanceolatum]